MNGHRQTAPTGPFRAMNGLMRCNKNGAVSENRLSGVHLVEQGLGLLQVEGIEAFGEPAVNLGE
jgi:hypothetical protein